MAKALFGQVGIADAQLAAEVRRLRRRVAELEAEVERVKDVNRALTTSITVDDEILRLTSQEPALT